jgi:S1-C subfamily serine protease
VRRGLGVPHQLRDLGVTRVAGALPWDGGCGEVRPGLADALFGVAAVRSEAAPPPRLGIGIEAVADGVRVQQVTPGSVAAQAGLLTGDVITRVAGQPLRDPDDLIQAVRRQPAGTILPLGIRRGDQPLELLPRFPPQP